MFLPEIAGQALTFAVIAVVGFTACAEFGSYAFVHPVIRRLPAVEQVAFEKGLLRTFGAVMPLLMTATPVLAGSWAATHDGPARLIAGAAAALTTIALITTTAVNVGINRATGHWDPADPPQDWQQTRRRWDRFQGIRSWLLLLGFVTLAAAVAV